MRSTLWYLAIAGAVVAFQGCETHEERQLERGGDDVGKIEDDRSGGVQQEGQLGQVDGALAASALDGKTYVVQLSTADQGAIEDKLIFDKGVFDSTACHPKGFQAAPYTATQDVDGTTSFSATTTNGEAAIRWEGQVTGDKIEGTAWMTEPGKPATPCRFEGKIADEGASLEQGPEGALNEDPAVRGAHDVVHPDEADDDMDRGEQPKD